MRSRLLTVFPEFRFFPEIRKSGSFRFFGRFFSRPRPLVRFPDFKKMLANSRVFHPRKLQTALCKPRENRLCPLRLPNLTISAALISTDQHWSLVVQYDVKTDSARMVCYSWLELRPSSHHCALYGIVGIGRSTLTIKMWKSHQKHNHQKQSNGCALTNHAFASRLYTY